MREMGKQPRERLFTQYLHQSHTLSSRKLAQKIMHLNSIYSSQADRITREFRNMRSTGMFSMCSDDFNDSVIGILGGMIISVSGFPERLPGPAMTALLFHEGNAYRVINKIHDVDPYDRIILIVMSVLEIIQSMADSESKSNPWVKISRRLPKIYMREIRNHIQNEFPAGMDLYGLKTNDPFPEDDRKIDLPGKDKTSQSIRRLSALSFLSEWEVRLALSLRDRALVQEREP